MNERVSEIANIIRGIHDVGSLTLERLIEISRKLFELIDLCKCVKMGNNVYHDRVDHKCKKLFRARESEHGPTCICCQTRMLLYYLGKCLDSLAENDRLPEFYNSGLTGPKIRDRTYRHIRQGSKLIFDINRHKNAFRDEEHMEEIVQTWEFDFGKLSLTKVE